MTLTAAPGPGDKAALSGPGRVSGSTPGAPAERIWEVDFLRGLSILLVVLYHAAYDLVELAGVRTLFGWEIPLSSPLLEAARNFFAGLFIVLCGVSGTLTRSNIRRALKLLAVALAVTAATAVFQPSLAVHFGILHCLGVCVLLYGLLLEKATSPALIAAAAGVLGVSIALHLFIRQTPIRFDWLLPLGVHSASYGAFDYFPLFPWLGVFLFGAAAGKSVYKARKSLIPGHLPVSFINIAGRHSLWIYILHQPLLIGFLYLMGRLG